MEALEKIREELIGANSSLKREDIPIIIADSTDYTSLTSMVQSTKVVITTAGPFDIFGSDLVKCCAGTMCAYILQILLYLFWLQIYRVWYSLL